MSLIQILLVLKIPVFACKAKAGSTVLGIVAHVGDIAQKIQVICGTSVTESEAKIRRDGRFFEGLSFDE